MKREVKKKIFEICGLNVEYIPIDEFWDYVNIDLNFAITTLIPAMKNYHLQLSNVKEAAWVACWINKDDEKDRYVGGSIDLVEAICVAAVIAHDGSQT